MKAAINFLVYCAASPGTSGTVSQATITVLANWVNREYAPTVHKAPI